MIHKQQLFIEENDIGMSPAAQAGSKYFFKTFLTIILDIEIFLGDNNDLEQDDDDDE